MKSPFVRIIEPPLPQQIRHAAVAAVVVVLLSAVIQAWRGPRITWESGIDVALVVLLAYLMNRKSRVAAIALVLYFIAAGIVQLLVYHLGLPLALYVVLGYFFGRGVPAVFRYHRAANAPVRTSDAG